MDIQIKPGKKARLVIIAAVVLIFAALIFFNYPSNKKYPVMLNPSPSARVFRGARNFAFKSGSKLKPGDILRASRDESTTLEYSDKNIQVSLYDDSICEFEGEDSEIIKLKSGSLFVLNNNSNAAEYIEIRTPLVNILNYDSDVKVVAGEYETICFTFNGKTELILPGNANHLIINPGLFAVIKHNSAVSSFKMNETTFKLADKARIDASGKIITEAVFYEFNFESGSYDGLQNRNTEVSESAARNGKQGLICKYEKASEYPYVSMGFNDTFDPYIEYEFRVLIKIIKAADSWGAPALVLSYSPLLDKEFIKQQAANIKSTNTWQDLKIRQKFTREQTRSKIYIGVSARGFEDSLFYIDDIQAVIIK